MVIEIDEVRNEGHGSRDYTTKAIIRTEHIKHINQYNSLHETWRVIMDNTDYIFRVGKDDYQKLKTAMECEHMTLPGGVKM